MLEFHAWLCMSAKLLHAQPDTGIASMYECCYISLVVSLQAQWLHDMGLDPPGMAVNHRSSLSNHR